MKNPFRISTHSEMLRKAFISIAILLGLFIGTITAQVLVPRHWGPLKGEEPVAVYVRTGASLEEVAAILKEEGIVSNARLLVIVAVLTGTDRNIIPGRHDIPPRANMLGILENLRTVDRKRNCFTVPEGYTMLQVAERLRKEGIAERDGFMRTADDGNFAARLGVAGARNFEGYLFPETYCVGVGESPENIVSIMYGQFRKVFDEELETDLKATGLSLHQAVTLASIIQKEASAEDEMPLVSAVFHNRLKSGMPLQSCATVIYALGEYYDGKLTRAHLKYDSPYNTYVNAGLPPGPVSNPGLAALRAAVRPAEVDYLFFVSMNNGRHKFSSTLQEHDLAVKQYQIYPQ